MKPQALLFGGSSTLGISVIRSLTHFGIPVALTCRNPEVTERHLQTILRSEKQKLILYFQLDFEQDQIENRIRNILRKIQVPTILVNLASVYLDDPRKFPQPSLWQKSCEDLEKSLRINFFSVWHSMRLILPEMIKARYGRIVNVSSGMGRYSDLDSEGSFYRISKLCVNGLTQMMATDLPDGADIKINSVCPGWFRSPMGGENASSTASRASRSVLRACLLRKDGPNGKLLRGMSILPEKNKDGF